MTNEELIADFLAKGGKIKRLPEKRVPRETLIPEVHRKRDILADLTSRAKDIAE